MHGALAESVHQPCDSYALRARLIGCVAQTLAALSAGC
jgi:hypothetical protein